MMTEHKKLTLWVASPVLRMSTNSIGFLFRSMPTTSRTSVGTKCSINISIPRVWSVGPKPVGGKMINKKAEILKMGVFRANLT